MQIQSKEFLDLLYESISRCTSHNIALSGGLDSSVIAYCIKERRPMAYTVIAEDFVARDLTYCQMIAANLNLPLVMIKANTDQIISAIEDTVKILGNFNDIEIRNSVVMYITLESIKDRGEKSIITGDGADELFAGYNFLLKKSNQDLEKDLIRISKIMHFPSKKIADALGITIQTPFLSQSIKEFANKVPVTHKIGIHNETKFGKWIIRKTFEGKIPHQIIWRQKTPMQDGAGTVGLTNLFNVIIPDNVFQEKIKKIKDKDGITIRTKESLYYYQIFKKHHDLPEKSNDDNNNNNKIKNACPDCKCVVNDNSSKFCRMCGRFPI